MRITLRLESVCLNARLLPEDAIAIIQEVGRSAVRQLDEGRTAIALPSVDDVFIDSFGDVGWEHAALVEPEQVVAGLGGLLESLLRIAEEADQYHFTPAVVLIIARATGAADTDPFSSPLEFLRTLDRLGPIDNNAALRALYHRWAHVPHAPALVKICQSRESLASAVPRCAPPAPARRSRTDVRELTLTMLAAVASTVLFVPVLLGMTPSTPADTTMAALNLRTASALPAAPLPARRSMVPARAAKRGARVAAAPVLLARTERTSAGGTVNRRPPRARTSLFTRVLAGDGRRYPVQPFPRPTGLD